MGKFNKVLIVYQRYWGIKFGQFLIEKIRQDMPNVEIGVLTVKEQADIFFRENNDLNDFAWYGYFDPVRDFPKEYLDSDDYNVADICKELKIDTPWEILYATRNHAKDYRKTFNYAFSPALNDDEMLDAFKAYYKLLKEIDENFTPDAIIVPNPVESFNILLEYYARTKNAYCIQVAPTSIKGYYQYVSNAFQGEGYIEEQVKTEGVDYSKRRKDAIAYIDEFRTNFITPECAYHDSSKFLSYEFLPMVKAFAKSARAMLYRKRLPKGLHRDHGEWHPWLVLRDYFMYVHYHNQVKRMKYDDLPKNGKFVFFPLQMQPELAIDVLAPYFTNQIEIARQIAMSLPEDYTLVVKDHPIMVGRRLPKYLKKIQDLPNVKLINYEIKTPEILNNCAGIIVTCGTIVFEAAMMGVPVVQLGNLASSFLLQNVIHQTDLSKLKEVWPNVLNKRFSGEDYEEHLIKYVSLSMEHSIETNYFEMWEQHIDGDKTPFWDVLKDQIINDKIKRLG